MAGAKVKGTGGAGQWDTGTANYDIRQSYKPASSGRGSNTGGFMGSPSQVASHFGFGRKKGRNKARSKSRGKRK